MPKPVRVWWRDEDESPISNSPALDPRVVQSALDGIGLPSSTPPPAPPVPPAVDDGADHEGGNSMKSIPTTGGKSLYRREITLG